jgi:hypothetical protein
MNTLGQVRTKEIRDRYVETLRELAAELEHGSKTRLFSYRRTFGGVDVEIEIELSSGCTIASCSNEFGHRFRVSSPVGSTELGLAIEREIERVSK